MDEKGVQSFLIIFSIVAFFLALAVIILFVLFQKRKNKLLREQQLAEQRYKEQIVEAQIEIKEDTLRNISWELHDNIGQLLTLAKIQIQNAQEGDDTLSEAADTVGKSLTEIRSLSKLINPDTFRELSLIEAVELEIARFNRLKYLKASLTHSKSVFLIDPKVELIFFRMLQEFFSNTMKHSKATTLDVDIQYEKPLLKIAAKDNGVGFDPLSVNAKAGIGLANIKNRAALVGAMVKLFSQPGKGTQFNLTYKSPVLRNIQ